jgi:hypothetical protein
MNVNAIGALGSYAYQSALSQTGDTSKAMSQGLAMVQSQVADARSLFSNGGSVDPLAALAGSAGQPALSSLIYGASPTSGNGSSVQDLLASVSGQGSPSPTVSALPWSVAMLTPASAQALVRYAYDQSQNPSHTAAQAAAAGQQSLLASGLNLLG